MAYSPCSWGVLLRDIDEAAAAWEKSNCLSRSVSKSIEDEVSLDSVGFPLPDSPIADEDSNEPSTSGEEYLPCPACKVNCSICSSASYEEYCFRLPSSTAPAAPVKKASSLRSRASGSARQSSSEAEGTSSLDEPENNSMELDGDVTITQMEVSQIESDSNDFPDEASSGSTIPAYEPPSKKPRFRFRVYAECELSPGSLCCWDSHEHWSARRVKAHGCPHRALALKAAQSPGHRNGEDNGFRVPSMTQMPAQVPFMPHPAATVAAAEHPFGSPPPFRPTPRRRRRWRSTDANRLSNGRPAGATDVAPIGAQGMMSACGDSTQSLPDAEGNTPFSPTSWKSPIASLITKELVDMSPDLFSPTTRDSFLEIARKYGPINIDVEKYMAIESLLQSPTASIPDLLQCCASPVGQCVAVSPEYLNEPQVGEKFKFPSPALANPDIVAPRPIRVDKHKDHVQVSVSDVSIGPTEPTPAVERRTQAHASSRVSSHVNLAESGAEEDNSIYAASIAEMLSDEPLATATGIDMNDVIPGVTEVGDDTEELMYSLKRDLVDVGSISPSLELTYHEAFFKEQLQLEPMTQSPVTFTNVNSPDSLFDSDNAVSSSPYYTDELSCASVDTVAKEVEVNTTYLPPRRLAPPLHRRKPPTAAIQTVASSIDGEVVRPKEPLLPRPVPLVVIPRRPRINYIQEGDRQDVNEVIDFLLEGVEYLVITESLLRHHHQEESNPQCSSTAPVQSTVDSFLPEEFARKAVITPRNKFIASEVQVAPQRNNDVIVDGVLSSFANGDYWSTTDADSSRMQRAQQKILNLLAKRCFFNKPTWEQMIKSYPSSDEKSRPRDVSRYLTPDPCAEEDVYDYIRVYLSRCARELKHSPLESLSKPPPRQRILDHKMRRVYLDTYDNQLIEQSNVSNELKKMELGQEESSEVKMSQYSASTFYANDGKQDQRKANARLVELRARLRSDRQSRRNWKERRVVDEKFPNLLIDKDKCRSAVPEQVIDFLDSPELDSIRFSDRKDVHAVWMPVERFAQLIKDPLQVIHEESGADSHYAKWEREYPASDGDDSSDDGESEAGYVLDMQSVSMLTKDWMTLRVEYCAGIPRNATLVVDPLTVMGPEIHRDDYGVRHSTLEGVLRRDTVPVFAAIPKKSFPV